MRVVVGNPLWSAGGPRLVDACAVKVLLEAGHEVAIASTSGFSKEKFKEWSGIDLGNARIYALLPRALPLFGIYQRLGFYISLKRAIKREDPEIVFVDSELYKPILRLKKERGFSLLEYIHFPFHTLSIERGEFEVPEEHREAFERYLAETRIYHKKAFERYLAETRYERGLRRLYFRLWLELYGRVARDNPFESADVVMTNSKYIARLIKIIWHGDALVLYPPVRIRDFEQYCIKTFDERDDAVIMIGRISPEKGIENVINAIALTETKPVLRVIGGLVPANIPYKKRLEKLAEEKNVKVKFYFNISRKELVKMVASSKVFVHAAIGEHFGIAVVEGMAAGCPAIVHKSGGPYEDIIDCGNYGLYYETVEELAEKIDKLMTDREAWKYHHGMSLRRAQSFSEERFAEKLLKVVEGV